MMKDRERFFEFEGQRYMVNLSNPVEIRDEPVMAIGSPSPVLKVRMALNLDTNKEEPVSYKRVHSLIDATNKAMAKSSKETPRVQEEFAFVKNNTESEQIKALKAQVDALSTPYENVNGTVVVPMPNDAPIMMSKKHLKYLFNKREQLENLKLI